jgi:hypothetical protein
VHSQKRPYRPEQYSYLAWRLQKVMCDNFTSRIRGETCLGQEDGLFTFRSLYDEDRGGLRTDGAPLILGSADVQIGGSYQRV